MDRDVSRLLVAENVRIQGEALNLLQRNLGTDGSQNVIERAVVEVAERMGAVEQALLDSDFDMLRKSARSLGSIGEQLGLLLMTKVAQDAVICAERQDMCALHAVVERLMRVGDASLAAVIDGASLPG